MKNVHKFFATAVLTIFFGLASSIVLAQTLSERDASAKAKYQQASGQYQKEVNFYKSAKKDFLNAKAKYQKLKNAENKKAMEDSARNFLEKAASSLIKRLEAVKNWASNNRALSETDRQTIVAEIDADIKWLNERVSKIQTATPDQIKEEAKTLQDYWKNHRIKVKRIIGKIQAARINFVITKAESFSIKVSAKIEELKAAGRDTSQLEAWLADFNQKLALAKEKHEASKVKFTAISNLAEANQLFREGHQFIVQANQYIRQSHAQLVQIVKEMKKIGATVEAPSEQ